MRMWAFLAILFVRSRVKLLISARVGGSFWIRETGSVDRHDQKG